MGEKPILNGLFRDYTKTPEGKYLVMRRDGSIPEWPHFVLGGADEAAEYGLRAYADKAERLGYSAGYVAGVRRWADVFARYRKMHKPGDPDRGPHRKDDPEIVAKMKMGFSA